MENKYVKNVTSKPAIITCGPLRVNRRLIAIIVSQLIFSMDHASGRCDIRWVSYCCLEKYRSAYPYWYWTTVGLRRSKERSNLKKRRSKSQSCTGRDSDFFAGKISLLRSRIDPMGRYDWCIEMMTWLKSVNEYANTVIKMLVHLITHFCCWACS